MTDREVVQVVFAEVDRALAMLESVAKEFVSGQISDEEAAKRVAVVCSYAPPPAVRSLDAYYERKVNELREGAAQ